MRPLHLPPISPVSFQQVLVYQRLQSELEELWAELEELPGKTPPSDYLIGLIRQHRQKLCRLMSREKASRTLGRFPTPPIDCATLFALLRESQLALAQFQKIHSSEFSEREDGFVVEEDF